MKTFFQTLAIAFSMFSAIPMPKVDWNERAMRHVMAAFPFVGAVIGAGVIGWHHLSGWLGFGPLLTAAGLLLLPIVFTGGIHLDGFCDTVDALASNTTPERRLQIMKDPNAGAFAVIWLSCYLLAFFALMVELAGDLNAVFCIALGFVLSRILSGFGVLRFACAKQNGLARTFSDAGAKKQTEAMLLLLMLPTAAGLLFFGGVTGGLMLLSAGMVFMLYHRIAMKLFGGITGDLAGWFLQLCEITTTAALVVGKTLLFGGVPFG